MLQESTKDLDALILEEKQRVAVEFMQEAWNNALREGIEPAILAEAGLVEILTQFQSQDGESAVANLIDTLAERLDCGHFNARRSLQ